jgi:ketosteroid isomerase-like protein
MKPVAFALAACLLTACATRPPDRAADEAAVLAIAARFIDGVETFDGDKAAGVFDKDATVFQPIGAPQRYSGGEAITASFRERFDPGRAAGQTQTITPKREMLQFFGDTAILTFELGDMPTDSQAAGRFGRRSLVLHRFPDGWRVVHLHGSNIQAPPSQ